MTDERTTPEAYLGTWRIQEIGERIREGIDLVGPAEIVFDKDGLGSIRFMSTRGDMDCRFVDQAGEVFAEFTWAGYRGTARASGRGWAHVLKTGGMMGHIYVHRQGDANFTAVRAKKRLKLFQRDRK